MILRRRVWPPGAIAIARARKPVSGSPPSGTSCRSLRLFARGLSRLAGPGFNRPGFNRNAAARALHLRHRDRDLQHTVVHPRLRLIYVDAFRQRDHPVETAIFDFRPIAAFEALFMLAPPLAFDDQAVVRKFDPDVVLIQAGKFGAHDEIIVALEDLHVRRPHLDFAGAGAARNIEAFERAIQLIRKAPHELERTHAEDGARAEREHGWRVGAAPGHPGASLSSLLSLHRA